MVRLLLLFMLFPIGLFGQNQRQAIVDSIHAAANDLHAISELISSNIGSKVERIAVSDSGTYVILNVRVRVDEMGIIPAIQVRPVVEINVGATAIARLTTVPLPKAPPVLLEIDTINALFPTTIHVLATDILSSATMPMLMLPPMPEIKIEPESLPVSPNLVFAVDRVLSVELDTVIVPDFEQKRMPVAEMHLSDEGYSLLEKMEGFSPELYTLQDGGYTIGFGFFVPYPERSKWGKGVSLERAEQLIREKVPMYEDQVKKYINVPLTQAEFDALTMVAYNLGGFSRATSIVNDINGDAGFDKLQRDWMRFIHSKAPGVTKGLINRRKDELKVRNELDYQPERKLQILKKKK